MVVATFFYVEVALMEFVTVVLLLMLLSLILSQRFQPPHIRPRVRRSQRYMVWMTLLAAGCQLARGVDPNGAFGILPANAQHFLQSQTTAILCQTISVRLVATLNTLFAMLKKETPHQFAGFIMLFSSLYYLAVTSTTLAEFFFNDNATSDLSLYAFIFVRNILFMLFAFFTICCSLYLLIELRSSVKKCILQLQRAERRQQATAAHKRLDGGNLVVSSAPETAPFLSPSAAIEVSPHVAAAAAGPGPIVVVAGMASCRSQTEFILALQAAEGNMVPLPPPAGRGEVAEEERNQLRSIMAASVQPVLGEPPFSILPSKRVADQSPNTTRSFELQEAMHKLFIFLMFVDAIMVAAVFASLYQDIAFIRQDVNIEEYKLTTFSEYPAVRISPFIFHSCGILVILWGTYLTPSIWYKSPYPFWETVFNGLPQRRGKTNTGTTPLVNAVHLHIKQQQNEEQHDEQDLGAPVVIPMIVIPPPQASIPFTAAGSPSPELTVFHTAANGHFHPSLVAAPMSSFTPQAGVLPQADSNPAVVDHVSQQQHEHSVDRFSEIPTLYSKDTRMRSEEEKQRRAEASRRDFETVVGNDVSSRSPISPPPPDCTPAVSARQITAHVDCSVVPRPVEEISEKQRLSLL